MEIAVFVLSVVTGLGALILGIMNYSANKANQREVKEAQEESSRLEELSIMMNGLRATNEAQANLIKDLRSQLDRRGHRQ